MHFTQKSSQKVAKTVSQVTTWTKAETVPHHPRMLKGGAGSRRLHFAFLFASPLIYRTDKLAFDPISYSDELNGIIEKLEEKRISIRYKYDPATIQGL